MNPKKVNLDRLSYGAIPLKLMLHIEGEEKLRGYATGFFVRYDNKVYLMTNRHVVTGIDNPAECFPADRPHYINYPVLKHKIPHIQWDRLNTQLYSDSDYKNPRWLIHPLLKGDVDVVAIPVNLPADNEVVFINEYSFDDTYIPMIADDVYVLGFPYALNGGANFPIWKKGSIASEPSLDLDMKPKIYIDTASREGMSGAPVIYRRRGLHGLTNDGHLNDESILGEIQNFVGVYSGRIKDIIGDPYDVQAQLGIVWKASVIEEIVMGNVYDEVL